MEHSDRTHEEIVEDFCRCAHQHGEPNATLSVRTLRRWLAGDVQTMPRPAQRRVAQELWGHPIGDLLNPPTAVIGPLRPERPEETSVPKPPCPTRAEPGPDDVNGETHIERLVSMSARRAASFATDASSSNVGAEPVEQLASDIGQLARAYVQLPVGAVLGDLLETQEHVFTLLEGRQKPTQTRDLYVLAGIASGLLAKASHDLRRPADAMTQARAAFVCADNADHLPLKAWIRGLQSLIAYWAGRPQEAAHYARRGSELTTQSDASGTVTVWLPALEARAAGQLGDRAGTYDALHRADEARAGAEGDDLDAFGGQLLFPEPKQHYYASAALTALGTEADEAQTQAEAATVAYRAADDAVKSFSDETGAQTELAIARLQQGEFDGARQALDPVLLLPPEFRIGGVVPTITRVHEALSTPAYAADPVVIDLRDEIETYCRTATIHQGRHPAPVRDQGQ